MENLKTKKLKIVIYYFLLIIFSILLVVFLQGINKLSLKVPFTYFGADEMPYFASGKMIEETGWIFNTSRLGAPFGTSLYDFTANMFSNFNNLFLKLLIFCTGDSIIGCNLYFISIFPLAASISFFVMRKLKINDFLSFCMSLLFAFTPYITMRGVGHIVLSSAYFVPLSILLCLWLYYSDDDYLVFNKNFFLNKKNWLTIIFCLLIANNGHGYYQFFTCFFVCVTVICKLLDNGTKYDFVKGIKIICFISLFFIISFIPGLIYFIKNGSNNSVGVRMGAEAERYGLKIFLLYLPPSSSIIRLQRIISNYFTTSPLTNENKTEYLGVLGFVGFTILLLKTFSRKLFEFKDDKLSLLSKLNLSAILLATIGGFGSIFSYLISPQIRGYNRISVYIAYLSLLCIAILFNEILNRFKCNILLYISIFFICFIALFEQTHKLKSVGNRDFLNSNFYSDKKFVERIEKLLPEHSMVFQLPFHQFPEGGPINGINSYHLMIGYLNSKTLRWSFGGIRGREADTWNKNISTLDLKNMIKALSMAGFSGIYIDKRAYKDKELNNLREEIKNILGEVPIESDNGNLLFYNMLEYNKSNSFSLEEKKKILNIISFSKGCYRLEKKLDTGDSWRWLNKEAEIIINNMFPDEQEYTFRFCLQTAYSNLSTVDIFVNGEKLNSYLVNNEKKEIKEKLTLKSGKNIFTIKTDAKKVLTPGDPREIYLRSSDYKLFDFE